MRIYLPIGDMKIIFRLITGSVVMASSEILTHVHARPAGAPNVEPFLRFHGSSRLFFSCADILEAANLKASATLLNLLAVRISSLMLSNTCGSLSLCHTV